MNFPKSVLWMITIVAVLSALAMGAGMTAVQNRILDLQARAPVVRFRGAAIDGAGVLEYEVRSHDGGRTWAMFGRCPGGWRVLSDRDLARLGYSFDVASGDVRGALPSSPDAKALRLLDEARLDEVRRGVFLSR